MIIILLLLGGIISIFYLVCVLLIINTCDRRIRQHSQQWKVILIRVKNMLKEYQEHKNKATLGILTQYVKELQPYQDNPQIRQILKKVRQVN